MLGSSSSSSNSTRRPRPDRRVMAPHLATSRTSPRVCGVAAPHDMQRNVSVLRELDNKYQGRDCGSSHPDSGPCTGRRSLPLCSATFPAHPGVGTQVWSVRGTRGSGPPQVGGRASPSPAADFRGLEGGRESWPLVSPHADPATAAAVKTKSAIFKQQAHLFRVFARRTADPSRPGSGSAAGRWRGACRGGVSAVRPRPDSCRPARAGLSFSPAALRPPPPGAQMH